MQDFFFAFSWQWSTFPPITYSFIIRGFNGIHIRTENFSGFGMHVYQTNTAFNSIQFKFICIAAFTIQSLQSSFTWN